MKLLFLVQAEQRAILERLYEGIAEAAAACDIRRLSSDQQANLRRYFREQVDVTQYDRILLFLRFKKEMRQVRFIRSIPNLVLLEHDAYQNYIPCKYTGAFSAHYRKIPGVRVITSGFEVTQRLQREGVDAVFVPKGYDQALLNDLSAGRDMELAFVGSTKSVAYSQRKAFLDELAQVEPLQVLRTKSGEEYCAVLNRIRFFVSADVGMGEYMIKNFEAMACGCVLFAYNQGDAENQALGLLDMHNLVLYRTVAELREKLQQLRTDPLRAQAIAEQGRLLAEANHRFSTLGHRIVAAMQPELWPRQPPTRIERLWRFLRG